jgi:hypothetical protein
VLHHRELTERIIGLAIEVHRHSGTGLSDSFYAANVPVCRHSNTARSWNSGDVKGRTCDAQTPGDILAAGTVIPKS